MRPRSIIITVFVSLFIIFPSILSAAATDTPTETFTATPAASGTPCACPGYFGRIEALTGGTTPVDGTFVANMFTLNEAAVVRSLSMNVDVTTGGQIRLAIYDNNTSYNAPGNLLAESSPQPSTAGWNTLDIPDTTLAPGNYWIAFQTEAGVEAAVNIGNSGDMAWFSMAFGPFPATLSAGSFYTFLFGLRADYCPLVCTTPTDTPTVTPTPTPIGACACGDEMGTTYQLSGSIAVYGFMVANWYGMPEDGAATSMELYVTTGSGNARMAIYSNSVTGTVAAQPGYMIVQSQPFAVSPGWNTVSIPQTTLYADTVYWLAYQTDSSSIYTAAETGSANSLYWQSYTFGAFPGKMSPGGSAAEDHSIHVNYCPIWCLVSPTATPTAGQSATSTPTETPTAALTATPSATRTATLVPTGTNTIVPTMTNTPAASQTFTASATASATATFTITPSPTVSVTATFTQTPAATSTATPVAVATTTGLELSLSGTYPNPYNPASRDLAIGYYSTRNLQGVTVRFYTRSLRLVMKYEDNGIRGPGQGIISIDREKFARISSGILCYVVEAKADNGTTSRSKISQFIILR